MADEAGVIHDAASLLRFVESIRLFCEIRKDYPAYLPASRDFLDFIDRLAQDTNRYLSSFPSRLPADPTDYPAYRQELWTLREGWSEIHRRIKPIADADTLRIPSALINSMVRRLQRNPKFEGTRLVVLHTQILNYLQVVASKIRGIVSSISTLVGAKEFPPNFGLIGIPYSQSESVFLNCLIAHEIGHFVFGELQLSNNLNAKIRPILDSVFAPVASSLGHGQKGSHISTIIADWAEELFCDLFAIRLIGPCYSYAYIEIFDVANILYRDGTLNRAAAALSFVFSESHPADLYRINKQAKFLQTLGWWNEIKDSNSNSKRVLEHAERLDLAAFSASISSLGSFQQQMLSTLDQAIPSIIDHVENALKGVDTGVQDYSKFKVTVAAYFRHGVVPSMIVGSGSQATKSPDPVTILNVAYQLYLDDLPTLIDKIESQHADSVEDRTRWTQRLEAWTLKALDDLELISMSSVHP